MPVAISFTIETDGRLPSGEPLREAIEQLDADTAPAYFGVNCAHPSHFEACFADSGAWTTRIGGIRANASPRSHAELDVATELDIGDPADLGERYRRLRVPLPALNVLGGCCGTDSRTPARDPRCMGPTPPDVISHCDSAGPSGCRTATVRQ